MKNSDTIRFVLLITPQTNIRPTKRELMAFNMPKKTMKEKYPKLYVRYRRYKRYEKYKQDLVKEANRVGFELPTDGAWIKFFRPMPKKWSKSKRREMDFKPHQTRPDLSNLHKAFEDALKIQDMTIYDYRCSKFWINAGKGFIECFVPAAYVDMEAIKALQFRLLEDPVIK